MEGSLIENGEEISKELNKYFLSVFSQEESDRELEPVQNFREQEIDKLNDILLWCPSNCVYSLLVTTVVPVSYLFINIDLTKSLI